MRRLGRFFGLHRGSRGCRRELLQRWTELNAFGTVLRTHEGNQPAADAQAYDDDGIAHFARMSKVYRALAFYRRSLSLCPYDKDVYLPPGKWVHLWTGRVVGDASTGAHVTVKAPVGQPAVF